MADLLYKAMAMPRHAFPAVMALAILGLSSCSAGNKTPSSPSPLPQPNSAINYTAIGASDAQAIGSSVECIMPFVDCPNGMGYVQVAARQLKANGYTVNLTNLGIATATLGRDFEDLGNQNGHLVLANFIENEAPVVNSNSTLITIFGGANDVNVVTSAMGRGAGASDQVGYINAQIKAFGADYTTLVNMLRGRAGGARMVVLNLPNMGAMPFLAGASAQQRQAAQLLSVGMTTTVINPLTAQGRARDRHDVRPALVSGGHLFERRLSSQAILGTHGWRRRSSPPPPRITDRPRAPARR